MRLLFITNVLPNPIQPTKGVFNLELVKALAAGNQVRAVCPVAWTDELAAVRRGKRLGRQRSRTIGNVPIRHPRFYFPPKILRPYYGQCMWHSVKGVVRDEIARLKPHALVSYWAHPDGEVAVRAAREAGVPSVVMVGGSDVLLLTQGRARQRRILKVLAESDAVVAVSNHIRQKLIGFGIPGSKLHVVERGVDTRAFHPGSREEARRRAGIGPNANVLLWVGRMVPVKGLDVLVRSCRELRGRGVTFDLFLIGDGPLREVIRRGCVKEAVAGQVHFIGPVAHSHLPDWYRAANVTVLPSYSEGIPNVLRESLACGTPFVASDVGGVGELMGNAGCRLVPAGDPVALADALVASLNHSPDGTRLGGGISWGESAQRLLDLIGRILHAGVPSPEPALAAFR